MKPKTSKSATLITNDYLEKLNEKKQTMRAYDKKN